MFLSCHVRVSEWIYSSLNVKGTLCLNQVRNLKFKWLQLDSNPQPLQSLQPNGVLVYELSGCGFKSSCSHLGSISELKHDIAELKRNTDNVMVGEIEFERAGLTAKNKAIESLLLKACYRKLVMSFFGLTNLRLAKFIEKVHVTIDLLIIVINLRIRMKHHSGKISSLKTILSTLYRCWHYVERN